MDDVTQRADETPVLGRRAFGRVLLVAGAAATVLTLSGCPGGEGDDDDDDDGDDD